MAERHTHIVIGAGAAGCAVAARLSEDPKNRVLLLEAGGRDWNPLIHMPAGFTKLTGPSVNWGFETVPQPELNGRRMHYPQGRTLGGSTSINAMIYIRGNRLDYDEWRDLGNDGWGYDGVLPYFRKSENNERLADEYHGTGGPMNVTEQVAHNPISKGFVRAAQSIGIPFSHDFNGAEQAGVGFYDVTQRNVRRESSATAYLGPARKRKNLVIATHSQATQLIVENGRAVGVKYLVKDKPTEARVVAGGEGGDAQPGPVPGGPPPRGEAGQRVWEEEDDQRRQDDVVRGDRQVRLLRIALLHPDRRQAAGLGVGPRAFDHARSQVEAQDAAGRTGRLRRGEEHGAAPAPDVQDVVARLDPDEIHERAADRAEELDPELVVGLGRPVEDAGYATPWVRHGRQSAPSWET